MRPKRGLFMWELNMSIFNDSRFIVQFNIALKDISFSHCAAGRQPTNDIEEILQQL